MKTKEQYLIEFGERVRAKRVEKNMTQQELAEALGFKVKQSVSHIETGKRSLGQTQIAQLSKILNCPIDYLMGFEKNAEEKQIVVEINEELSIMESKQLARLLQYAKLINKGDL